MVVFNILNRVLLVLVVNQNAGTSYFRIQDLVKVNSPAIHKIVITRSVPFGDEGLSLVVND